MNPYVDPRTDLIPVVLTFGIGCLALIVAVVGVLIFVGKRGWARWGG